MTADRNVQLTLDRRTLVRWGLSSTVLAALPIGGCATPDQNAELLRFASDSEGPLDPARTGPLAQADFEALAALPAWIDRAWELGGDMDAYLPRLQADLAFKTGQAPSYLHEYEAAVALIDRVSAADADLDRVWATLLFSESSAAGFEGSRLGRARRLVFAELIRHQIPLSGGFKSFGLVNYRGYMGGSFELSGSYRRARS